MQAVTVDDTSPEIDYLTGWYYQNTTTPDYNSTTAYSGNPGSQFEFTFNGTSVSVYGCVLPNNTAASTYTLDAAAPASYTNANGSEYLARRLFYQSPDVPAGQHTLVVTVPHATIGLPWTTFCFDYLTYVPANGSAAPTSPGGGAPAGGGAVQGTGGAKSNNLHIILPAVLVPCVVLIALLAAGLYWQRRRLARLETRIDQASVPYTQSSTMHRTSAPATLDTKFSAHTRSVASAEVLSPRPESSYSSEVLPYERTAAQAGSAHTERGARPGIQSLLDDLGSDGGTVELGQGLVAHGGDVRYGRPEGLHIDIPDAPPTYSARTD